MSCEQPPFSIWNDYQWRCEHCNEFNYPSNRSCFSCKNPKPIHWILITPITQLGWPGQYVEGDWVCFSCRKVNIKIYNSTKCRECRARRPVEYGDVEEVEDQIEVTKPRKVLTDWQYKSNREERDTFTDDSKRDLSSSDEHFLKWTKRGVYQTDYKPQRGRENKSRGSQKDRSRSRSFIKEKEGEGKSFASKTQRRDQSFEKSQNMQHLR